MDVRADSVRAHLEQHGYALARGVATASQIAEVSSLIEPLLMAATDGARPGVRQVLRREPRVAAVIAGTGMARLARDVCGSGVGVVRAIVFDKSPKANWAVAWHQDAVIAVRERHEVAGYGPWSVKAGEHHCRPPRAVIEGIAVLRLHLDPCDADQGPLRVVAGSHVLGALDAASLDREVAAATAGGRIVDCAAAAGDVVLMRPLTIHSSIRATRPAERRRVLHLECCAMRLTPPLEWGEWTAIEASTRDGPVSDTLGP